MPWCGRVEERPMVIVIGILVGVAVGAVLAFFALHALTGTRLAAARRTRQLLLAEARREADALRREAQIEAREQAVKLRSDVEEEVGERRAEIIKIEERAQTESKRRARNLVADALQRVAANHAAETTVSLVELPSDDMKGRIIGREGRNIRTLEHLTGVDFIIDDTPQAVVKTAKRAALLHDIGKALTHEVEGSHALLSAQYSRRYGETPAVVHAIEAHHYEVEPQTVEAVLLIAADAISASRPGARGESLEQYIKRLEALEEVAARHDGVEKVYALQAGREIRVLVKPKEIDDDGAVLLSHEIAREIEDQLEYPGQIKVTVIRESRAIEYAK